MDVGYECFVNEELVVYEVLMRDFIGRRDYQILLDILDYLEKLGINVIEFMLVNEFENNNSWGYNFFFYMVFDKYYGMFEVFKILIDEVYVRGIVVIVDVVYNYVFS